MEKSGKLYMFIISELQRCECAVINFMSLAFDTESWLLFRGIEHMAI